MNRKTEYSDNVHGRNLIKILRAIDALSNPQGVTVKELQRQLGISRRSVYRLFETLEQLQFPVYDNTIPGEREKRWHLEESYLHNLPNLRLPDVKLTLREQLALYFLLSRDRVFTGTPVESLLASVRQKLGLLIPADYLSAAQTDRLQSIFVSASHHPKNYSHFEVIFENLLKAIVERISCTVTYTALSHGRTKSYNIDPLRLFEHDGALYLFAQLPGPKVIRILAVDRIEEISLLNKHFDEPNNFYPEELLETTFDLTLGDAVEITIQFTSAAARRVRGRTWAKNQEITEQQDGSLSLTMETSGKADVLRWVLSFGDQAKITNPPELIEEFKMLISSLSKVYNR
ncbi:MAG: WYL domain-containing transcriptional regulator [Spirochaetia bacterium]|nr:WYL domain-containing transcriptional regulator [Spirochaetia bacterium]